MKVLICGVGALGSNLVFNLVPDLKGQHEITVLDRDNIEERNITAGTQKYTPDQAGVPKVQALQYNIWKWFHREIDIINTEIEKKILSVADLYPFDCIVDCFDNYSARNYLQNISRLSSKYVNLIHVGFSDNFTFAIEWEKNYTVPSDFTKDFDICTLPSASAFVSSIASLGALVVEEFINNGKKIEIVGGKFTHSLIQ